MADLVENFEIPPPDENPFEPVDVFLFKEEIEDNFFTELSTLPQEEAKILYIHPSLLPKFNFFINPDKLKSFNVRFGIFPQTPNFTQPNFKNIIFAIPPNLAISKFILAEINTNYTQMMKQIGEKERDYHIFFVPKANNDCCDVFKSSIYSEYVTFHNIGFDVFPLDYDLVSLEQPEAFKQLFIDKNYDSLAKLSQTLVQFELLFGKFKYRYTKGDCATALDTLLRKDEIIYEVNKAQQTTSNKYNVLGCVLMDRNVDPITPLLMPWTYEALLNLEYDGKLNKISLTNEQLGRQNDKKQNKVNLDLSKNDRFYTMIKNYHIDKMKNFVKNRVKQSLAIINKTKQSENTKELPKLLRLYQICISESSTLKNHLSITIELTNRINKPNREFKTMCEQQLLNLQKYDENAMHIFRRNEIAKKQELYGIIRLLCLEYFLKEKKKDDNYDIIRNDVLHVYGFHHLILFKNLEKLNYFRKSDFKYTQICETLELFTEGIKKYNPIDISYVFHAFRPISVRLIELLFRSGWKTLKIMSKIPGQMRIPGNEEQAFLKPPSSSLNVVVLVYIGGITYSEVAAIRFLKKIFPFYNFIIFTTAVINYKSFLGSIDFHLNNDDTIGKSFLMKDIMTKTEEDN